MSIVIPKRFDRMIERQDEIIVDSIIAMVKDEKEDNPDLLINDEILVEVRNALRQNLIENTFNLKALKSAAEGSSPNPPLAPIKTMGLQLACFVVLTHSLGY
jgi:hypothetical protein